MIGARPIAIDDPNARTRSQRRLQLRQEAQRLRNLVIHLQHQHRIH